MRVLIDNSTRCLDAAGETASSSPCPNGDSLAAGAHANNGTPGNQSTQIHPAIDGAANFRAVFDRARTPMALLDLDGRIQQSNSALQALLGYDEAELQHQPLAQFTHPVDRLTDWEQFQQLVAGTQQEYQIDKRYRRRD